MLTFTLDSVFRIIAFGQGVVSIGLLFLLIYRCVKFAMKTYGTYNHLLKIICLLCMSCIICNSIMAIAVISRIHENSELTWRPIAVLFSFLVTIIITHVANGYVRFASRNGFVDEDGYKWIINED